MKIYLETMGCQMNRLDSELAAGALVRAGHELVDGRKAADVVLYNTCSVRRHAEQKVLSRLGSDAQRKAHHRPGLIIGVLGCMAQRLGGRLRRRVPAVDIVCGPGQLYRLAELIERAARGESAEALDPPRGRTGAADDGEGGAMDRLDLGRDPAASPARSRAYVRVMRGCDNFCTYCIVPYVRGPERSRPVRHVVEEVRRLVEAGRSEITLLGQAVNRYQYRHGRGTARLSDLLERLSPISGLRRLRFVTSHPCQFTDDLLEAMRDLPNVCEFIHCPPQSGSDAVLERMKRRYTRSQYDELVDRARQMVPGVVLAGDFIVGFPGETERDHQASMELIRRSGFKNSFIFKYSPRPGTYAAEHFADDVPDAVKRRRNAELLAVQQEVGLAHHRGFIGRIVEVLVEGPSVRADKQARRPTPQALQLTGRTRGDHIVHFYGPADLADKYVHVRVTDATALALLGELAEPAGETAPPRAGGSSQG
ncbi:MAG: tRNA (N6-isopentenyl adenosine(37)-C2)-methylthiotransferase MiaB [Planctomycetes bacterium]|nr:tRNA (N6-isopentenyl adenosine(37)-C2)-methylthiotransferase MiaB [Planctomycetota bacterium]